LSTVVVSGALANKAGSGGEAWVRLSWIRGLRRLGLDVWFVEELAGPPEPEAMRWFADVVAEFGLADRATLLVDGEAAAGPARGVLLALAPETVLVNISGHLRLPALFDAFRSRVLVDLDPGFTQFWHAAGETGARVAEHDLHFTIAENIGRSECTIPTSGIDWRPVRQPVVLDDWPVVAGERPDRFTTIATWRASYGAVDHDGERFGLKLHEFRRMVELPQRSAQHFELALDIHPGDDADRALLEEHGWQLVDPRAAAGSTAAFRRYVQGSGAEFSVAQGAYVQTRSGWFSDRTLRYLASGRPALVQDTAAPLPRGTGLVTFSTLDEAVAGAEDIVARYAEHGEAARTLVARHFDSDVVLARFCQEAGIDV
jgi:hypothetical protein